MPTARLYILCISMLCFALMASMKAGAQESGADKIRLGAIVVEGDTIAMVFLETYEVIDKMPAGLVRARQKDKEKKDRMRYNVYKVYPYAVIAAEVLRDVDYYLDRLPDKKARKDYLKTIENDLNKKFKGELKNLTISQGQMLVKLISRQTGRNCFHIIKELKGGFNAVVFQSVALLFSNNLKREYDPYDRDRDIEAIVRELEAQRYYEYQQRQQGARK